MGLYLLVCKARTGSFSLPRSFVPMLVMNATFGQKSVRVYGRQGKLDKCTRVVYHLHGNSGDSIRKVNGTSIFRRPNRNFA